MKAYCFSEEEIRFSHSLNMVQICCQSGSFARGNIIPEIIRDSFLFKYYITCTHAHIYTHMNNKIKWYLHFVLLITFPFPIQRTYVYTTSTQFAQKKSFILLPGTLPYVCITFPHQLFYHYFLNESNTVASLSVLRTRSFVRFPLYLNRYACEQ